MISFASLRAGLAASLGALLLLLSFAGLASAHTLWLEREGDGVRLHFGEFDENLREASPGLLNRLKPEAKVAGSDKALKLDKTAGFFAVAGTVAPDDSVVAETVAINERRVGDLVELALVLQGRLALQDLAQDLARPKGVDRPTFSCFSRTVRW